MTVTIWRTDSPLARCHDCGSQKQFHGQPRHSCQAFVPETIADYEPADLSPAQLASEIFAYPNSPRAMACGAELRAQIRQILGVDFEDLQEALR